MFTNGERGGVYVEAITSPARIPKDALGVYCAAFGGAPYFEQYTPQEARSILTDILKQKGDLLIGRQDGQTVSLAAGVPRPDGTYYISELAVRPESQNKGIGRTMLAAQLEAAEARRPRRIDLRTSVRNDRARALYREAGFREAIGTTVVASQRQDGSLAIDERLYMYRPPISAGERRSKIEKIAIAYPSGNTTAVVFDQFLGDDRKALNNKVMSGWKKRSPSGTEVEQCCFVTTPRNSRALARVEMFGGEFCGNATRSVAYLLTGGQDYKGLIEVSGAPNPLEFEVKNGVVSVEMPLPRREQLATTVEEGTLVQLDGIAQLVVTDADLRKTESPRDLLKQLLKQNKYKLKDEPCVGVSYYDQTSGKAEFCVWVKAVNTTFDETACGSGTSAIGIAAATQAKGSVKLAVVQPSGESIVTEATFRGKVTKSTIAGRVNVLYEGDLAL